MDLQVGRHGQYMDCSLHAGALRKKALILVK